MPNILDPGYSSYYRPGNFKFEVYIGKASKPIGMNKVSGLSNSTDVIEYREGGEVELNHKFPGLTKVDNITMERAIAPKGSNDAQFFLDWEKAVLDVTRPSGGGASNTDYRKLVKVNLLDRTGAVVSTWYCYNCWPTKVSWSDFDAGGNEVQRETVELACEYVQRVYGTSA